MGLLDDAIREHLELKRRHGADPGDVERQEREALGAARERGEFARPDEAAADEPSEPDSGAPFDVEEPREFGEPESVERSDVEEPGEPASSAPFNVEEDEVPPAEPEVPAPGEEAGAPGYDEDPWLEEERDEVPSEESLDRPSGSEAESEDVLEETPDFLQETPEHDRLWFEQRPPRDFDWDK
jgi:hypothetical protein